MMVSALSGARVLNSGVTRWVHSHFPRFQQGAGVGLAQLSSYLPPGRRRAKVFLSNSQLPHLLKEGPGIEPNSRCCCTHPTTGRFKMMLKIAPFEVENDRCAELLKW